MNEVEATVSKSRKQTCHSDACMHPFVHSLRSSREPLNCATHCQAALVNPREDGTLPRRGEFVIPRPSRQIDGSGPTFQDGKDSQ